MIDSITSNQKCIGKNAGIIIFLYVSPHCKAFIMKLIVRRQKKICFLFLKESISLEKLHIDGTDIYANYKGWENVQKEEPSPIKYWEVELGLIST